MEYYAPFYFANIPVDIVSPDADLSKYKVVLAPALYVVPPDLAERLSQFVHRGGLLIVGFRSGVKDEHNRIVTQPLPGLLAEVLGAEVAEYDAVYDQPQGVCFLDPELGEEAQCELWADILRPTTAQVLAEYTQDYCAGQPAITINRWGQGRGQAVYLGTGLSREALGRVLVGLAMQQGVVPLLNAPQGVEVARRSTGDAEWWFILNHTPEEKSVDLPGPFIEAWSGQPVASNVQVDGYGVRALKPAS